MVVSAALGSVLAWLHRLDCADAFAQHCKMPKIGGKLQACLGLHHGRFVSRVVCLVAGFFVDTLMVQHHL